MLTKKLKAEIEALQKQLFLIEPVRIQVDFDFSLPIYLYADGSCLHNPGPGGFALIALQKQADRIQKGFWQERQPDTTNNRMELSAVLAALRLFEGASELHFLLDSQYVLKGVQEWMPNWKKNRWKKTDKKPVLNADLWQAVDGFVYATPKKFGKLCWHWVEGHAGNVYNELCDQLAKG